MSDADENGGKASEIGDVTLNYSRQDDAEDLRVVLSRIENRLNRLEFGYSREKHSENSPSLAARPPFSSGSQLPPTAAEACSPPQAKEYPFDPDSNITAESPVSDQVQEQFNSIKSSLEKVVLPTHLKLHDSRTGIKR